MPTARVFCLKQLFILLKPLCASVETFLLARNTSPHPAFIANKVLQSAYPSHIPQQPCSAKPKSGAASGSIETEDTRAVFASWSFKRVINRPELAVFSG